MGMVPFGASPAALLCFCACVAVGSQPFRFSGLVLVPNWDLAFRGLRGVLG